MRAGVGIRGIEELRDETRHLLPGEWAMDLDRGLTRQRRADAFAHARDVRRFFFERRVDELAQKGIEIVAHELRRERRDRERVA